MGCGASRNVQGPEQDAVDQTTKNPAAVPLAEDKQAAQEPGVKDVKQSTGQEPAAGAKAPDPAPRPNSSPDSGGAQVVQPLQSAASESPSSWADELSPCSPAPGVPLWSDDPAPASAPAAAAGQPPGSRPPQSQQPSQLQPAPSSNGITALDGTRLVLGASTSSSTAAAPSSDRSSPSRASASLLDPAVTPSCQSATVTLLPSEGQGGGAGRSRYTDEADLTINSHSYDLDGRGGSDSDEDEVAALFTLQAWKRFYNYNKRKAGDLLGYFWRRFSPQDYSCFCISYRNQELFVTPFMAENCVHGYCARLEDMGLATEVFLQMYSLHDPEADAFRIVGLLLVAGSALPPALAALSAFDGFVYQRAETGRTMVRQFLSALLVGYSPMHSLTLISGREVL